MTDIITISKRSLHRASDILAAGGLVAFPTETVYGLGANACDGKAVAGIFAAKDRPSFNPLISHVASLDAAFRLGIETELADILARCFWPGPLTLVLNRQPDCPVALLTTAGLDKIAVRVPANKHAQRLLQICDMPIAAPSANPSGRISPSTADHVHAGLAGKIDLILDGGPCEDGLESTIIDCSGSAPVLLRPGGIARDAIETALQSAGVTAPLIDAPTSDSQTVDPQQPVAPGQLRSHYAPEAGVRLNATTASATEELIGFGPVAGAGQLAMSLSQTADLREAATNLFAMLHQADAVTSGTDRTIAIAPIPDDGIGEAINDRLRRAAAPRD
ncbi:L-threonylcarbamoyladenylate synthase [Alphaproteobacteria bacterium]|nr:L-threonylcarbamoyladenylate synthase [Alphaproteobacteria bacterium]